MFVGLRQQIIEGQFKVEYSKGRLDEMTMTYVGERPLVFAVHLEKIEFDKNDGGIIDMKPLSQIVKLLAIESRIWE